jgi:hypothetical protein
MVKALDGKGWLMELSGTPDRVEVSNERVGHIVRITGTALIRHPTGDIRQPNGHNRHLGLVRSNDPTAIRFRNSYGRPL